jgi:hypothetical protein
MLQIITSAGLLESCVKQQIMHLLEITRRNLNHWMVQSCWCIYLWENHFPGEGCSSCNHYDSKFNVGVKYVSAFCQLQGKVSSRFEISVQQIVHISNIDVDVYNKALELASGKFAHLFHQE